MSELKEFKDFSRILSVESGKVIKKYFRTSLNIESKADNSPVTIADKKSEEIMRELITKYFPDHGILGEEFGEQNKNAEYKWILDPIDGTKSFIHGMITFGTLIALTRNGNPILGVVNQPVTGELLIGDNNTANLNGESVSVSENNSLDSALLLTTDYLNIEKYQDMEKFTKLMHKVKLTRTWGNCFGYYLVATGKADIMIDPIMSIWDSAALIPIIKGAGGIITDYQGNDPIKGKSIVAASKNLHSIVINILN